MERNRSNQRGGRGGYNQYDDDNYGSSYGGGRNPGGTGSYGSKGGYGSPPASSTGRQAGQAGGRIGHYNRGGSYGQGQGYGSQGGGSTFGSGSGQEGYSSRGSSYGMRNRNDEPADYGRDYDFGESRGRYRNEYEEDDRGEDRNFFERIGHGIRNAWDRITGHEEEEDRDQNYLGEARGYDYSRGAGQEGRSSGVIGNHSGASYGGSRRRTHQGNWGSAYGSRMNDMNEDWQGGDVRRGDYGQGGYGSRGVSNYGSDTHWGGRYGSQGNYRGDESRESGSQINRPIPQSRGQQGSQYNRNFQEGNAWRGPESYGGNYGNYGTGQQQSQNQGNVSGFGSTYGGNYSGEQGGRFTSRINQPAGQGQPGSAQSRQGTGQNSRSGQGISPAQGQSRTRRTPDENNMY